MNRNEDNNNLSLEREKKVSLHLLVDPEMKQAIVNYARKANFENTSQAGRAILSKGLEVISKENPNYLK